MSYILANNLTKRYKVIDVPPNGRKKVFFNDYKYIPAINNLTFSIEKGEIVGYIGPNGAGKSTTIKILSGILMPDEGHCTVNGVTPWENRKKFVRNIGVMFGQRSQLLWDLTPLDSFELLKRIYQVDEIVYQNNLNLLIDMLGLSELINKNVREMSLGQRMLCELAATFIHDPQLVFLDEPTLGIDIEVKRKFHTFIKEINAMKNVTVFITTHDLDDIQSLCNKLMIINKGELYFNDEIDELFMYEMPGMIEAEIELPTKEISLPPYAKLIEKNGNKYKISIDDSKRSGEFISLIANQYNLKNIYAEKPRIEEIIHRIYTSFK